MYKPGPLNLEYSMLIIRPLSSCIVMKQVHRDLKLIIAEGLVDFYLCSVGFFSSCRRDDAVQSFVLSHDTFLELKEKLR